MRYGAVLLLVVLAAASCSDDGSGRWINPRGPTDSGIVAEEKKNRVSEGRIISEIVEYYTPQPTRGEGASSQSFSKDRWYLESER